MKTRILIITAIILIFASWIRNKTRTASGRDRSGILCAAQRNKDRADSPAAGIIILKLPF